MKNRLYVVLGALVFAAVGGLLWWSPWARPGPGPMVRVFDKEFIALQSADAFSDSRKSNSIPQLVKAVRNQDTLLGKAYSWTWRKLAPSLQRRLPPPPMQYNGIPVHRARISAVVATLRQESLEESMDHLIAVKYYEQYLYPGFFGAMPFSQDDLEIMLSARRSIRVLQDIEKLRDRERESMCKRLFSKALEANTNSLNAVLRHEDDPTSKFEPQPGGSSVMTMALAMFIAADIGRLDILHEQFTQLDECRAAVHVGILACKAAHPASIVHLLERRAVPDNRFQANVLRLAACRSGNANVLEGVDAECERTGMRTHEIDIVPWDARTTWFEHLVATPMDTSKGVRRLQACDWDDDGLEFPNEAQERIVAKLRSIVLGHQRR